VLRPWQVSTICLLPVTDPLWSEMVVSGLGSVDRANETPGGAKGTRTPDPLLAKQVLFQLSYSPGKPQVTRPVGDPSIRGHLRRARSSGACAVRRGQRACQGCVVGRGWRAVLPLHAGIVRAWCFLAVGAVVTDVRGLIGLLQRADWTRLSLSAELSDGSKVLVAPGMRYRYESAEYQTGCDGGRPWEIDEEEDDRSGSVHWVSGPQAPLARLLCPAWLLDSSQLEVRGSTQVCGREALDVVMTRRPTLRTAPVSAEAMAEVVEVVVDAESGILLRIPEWDEEDRPGVLEIVRADFSPVIDASRFQPPPGSRIAEGFGDAFSGPLRPAWLAATTLGGLAAGALGAWIRYSPSRRTAASDSGGIDYAAEIPRDEPAPDRAHDGAPVSDDILCLLHAGGPTELQATLHEWVDIGAAAASVPGSARRAGLGGLGLLMDAVSEKGRAGHMVSELRFAGPGIYQVDRRYQSRRRAKTIACDGQRRWQVYADKITTEPARRPPGDIGNLADPSWLLQCTLSGGAEVALDSRSAYQINAVRRTTGGDAGSMLFPAAVAVIDAELGLMLRLTFYIGDMPVRRYELRDVTTSVGDFRPGMPEGLPVVEQARPYP
jgi:hypothetical protein